MSELPAISLLAKLEAPFPASAIKQREGGGKRKLSYVETQTVIRRLNQTAGAWSFSIKSLELHGDVWVVVGSLTIDGLGSREGIGVQRMSERQREASEDLIKGAASDALKKAATLFGVALDLYGPDYEGATADSEPVPRANQPERKPSPASPIGDDDQISLDALQRLTEYARERGVGWPRVLTRAEEQFDKVNESSWTMLQGKKLYRWIGNTVPDKELAAYDAAFDEGQETHRG